MDRRIQHLIRRSVWIPVWKCNHKEPPLGLPNHNWHHPELHPWPVHLAHKITQWCVNFSHMIGSRIPYSEMMEEILKQYPCSNMAARPDEYVKFFIMPSTHQECASRPSAPALPQCQYGVFQPWHFLQQLLLWCLPKSDFSTSTIPSTFN